MQSFDLHTHTKYSDGNNTVEEMILSAIDKGLKTIGISDHSYTFYDESYCMKKEDIKKYIDEINSLKEKYKDKIEVLCGIELDYYSDIDTSGFDYVIGSVHYIKIDDEYVPIDEDFLLIDEIARKYFGGDIYEVISRYYENVKTVVDKTDCDYIGHFDYISKYNEIHSFFDEEDIRYKKLYEDTVRYLVTKNIPFEINTAAYTKGIRKDAYPKKSIRDFIKSLGGKFILSSDSHNKDSLAQSFDKFSI